MSIAKRILNHETWINDNNERDFDFNPAPRSKGWDLFEHWEVGASGEPYLLLITSSPNDVGSLAPGSFILRRRWAPAGATEIVNHATPEESGQ